MRLSPFEKHMIVERRSVRGKAGDHSKPIRVPWRAGSHDVVSRFQLLEVRENGFPGTAQLDRNSIGKNGTAVLNGCKFFVAIASSGYVSPQPEVFPDACPEFLPMVKQIHPDRGR
jgi:hypothetical protein